MKQNLAIAMLAILTVGVFAYGRLQSDQVEQIQASAGATADPEIERLRAELREAIEAGEREQATLARQNEQLRQQLAELTASAEEDLTPAQRELAQLRDEIFRAQDELDQQAEATQQAEAAAREAVERLEVKRKQVEVVRLRTALTGGPASPGIDQAYGPLFDLLGLSEEDRIALKGSLRLRDHFRRVIPREPDSRNLEILRNSLGVIDTGLRELVGEENVEVFDAYEETLNERVRIAAFNQRLAEDQQLDPTQQDDLAWAMRHAREDFLSLSDVDLVLNPLGVDYTQMTPEAIERQLTALAALNEQYIAAAQSVLDIEQLAELQASLDEQFNWLQETVQPLLDGSLATSTPPATEGGTVP